MVNLRLSGSMQKDLIGTVSLPSSRSRHILRLLIAAILGMAPIALFTVSKSEAATLEEGAVVLDVSEGVRRVRVQILDEFSGQWETYAIAHLDGRKGRVKIRIPKGATLDRIRLHSSSSDAYPQRFFKGKSRFSEIAVEGSVELAASGRFATDSSAGLEDSLEGEEGTGSAVEEADIWKLIGETIYFFNQFRGLQIFDLSNRDNPILKSSLRMPAVGEDLYLLEGDRLALLTNQGWNVGSSMLLIDVSDESAQVTESFPIPGYVFDSRRVGDRIYVAAQHYETGDEGEGIIRSFQNVRLLVFDVSGSTDPKLVSEQDFPGYASALTATETHLLLAVRSPQDWSRSSVHVLALGSSEAPEEIGIVDLVGALTDKFKMQFEDGVLTTITQVRGADLGGLFTRVETFAFDEGVIEPKRLDQLDLAESETLYATRFDGGRVYIVTFLRIDPLWIVDLSDPSNLQISGELEIPGWSTYLEPMGDQLLAIGVEDRSVTVSLFDVSDPFNPTLTERIAIGNRSSWSEAVYDEKAVGVLQDQSLVLVPYQSFGESGAVNAVQLIEMKDDTLVERGSIVHEFPARRATALGEANLVSISQKELFIIDIEERDFPEIVAQLEISWATDRVIVLSEFLIQIENGHAYWEQSTPKIRVTPIEEPDSVLAVMELEVGSLVGATLRDDLLYLIQRKESGGAGDGSGSGYDLLMTIVDFSQPEEPILLGDVGAPIQTREWIGQLEALWLDTGSLVWYSRASDFFFFRSPYLDLPEPAFGDIVTGFIAIDARRSIFNYQNAVQFFAFAVTNSSAPEFSSAVTVRPEFAWQFSEAFSGERLILMSYDTMEWTEGGRVSGSFLQVIDYLDLEEPILRDPLGIPGKLEEIQLEDLDSGILFTSSAGKFSDETGSGHGTMLEALAFDGANVFLIDEIAIEEPYYTPSTMEGKHYYKGISKTPETSSGVLHLYWDESGFFDVLPSRSLDEYLQGLRLEAGYLLAFSQGRLHVADESDPFQSNPFQSYDIAPGLWLSLDEAAVVEGRGAWFSAGDYGVESVIFEEVESASPLAEFNQEQAASATAWIDIANQVIQLSTTDEADSVGILHSDIWLFVQTDFRPFDLGSTDVGDGWKWSEWFGVYNDVSLPWVIHGDFGWIYIGGDSVDDFWFWTHDLGWIWTGDSTFPFAYQFEEDSWLWFLVGQSDPQWYYDFGSDSWLNR